MNNALKNPNDRQVGGGHYKVDIAGLEHWDVIEDHGVGYLEAAITKYLTRVKNPHEDYDKSDHCAEKLFSLALKGRQPRGVVPLPTIAAYLLANNVDAIRGTAICLLLSAWSLDDLQRVRAICQHLHAQQQKPTPVAAPQPSAVILPFPAPTSRPVDEADAVAAVERERGGRPLPPDLLNAVETRRATEAARTGIAAPVDVARVLRFADLGDGELRAVPVPAIPRRPSTLGVDDWYALSGPERERYVYCTNSGEYTLKSVYADL